MATLSRLLLSQKLSLGMGKDCKSVIPEVETLLKNILSKGIPIYSFKKGQAGAILHCVAWKVILGAFWLVIAYYRTCNWRRANMYIEQGLKTINGNIHLNIDELSYLHAYISLLRIKSCIWRKC